ncbi:serine carboxypeptidase-like 18 isoform X2 [Prosopis cineraria]|uniref:serine carboxypeptidase-like 18 isoform X2 n=1 Tax=Prosopis cineraria TaxID=364024 RepID=UPI00240F13FF|nr:serine carboxypeptidase-like 18 isoform X2 [Prosopis cineraria]
MGWRWCCVMLVLLLFAPFMASSRSIIKNLPGFSGDLPFKLETGYIGVGEEEDVQLFYLFVESQRNPSKDPILLWFVGGPGCSALSAFLFENGPVTFDRESSGILPTLILNPYAWTQVLNVMYIDLPVGTGFSYSQTQEGYHSSDIMWIENAYDFLQKWFMDHPEFGSNSFYVGGGSYSTLPAVPLVKKLYEGFRAGGSPLINIKGLVLASPSTDVFLDMNSRIVYAHHLGLISDELYESIKASCNGDYVNMNPNNTKCASDYEAYSQGYDHILVNQWANNEDVRKALQIREGTKGEFLRCNKSLSYKFHLQSVVDYHRNFTKTNLQCLVYCADLDLAVPHISTQAWIKSLNMKIEDPWRAWFVDGQVAGYTQIYKNHNYFLTYVAVKGAGHVAQSYKPKEVLQMIDRWFSYSII